MKTKTIPRSDYNKAKTGYPQKEVVRVGTRTVKVRPEDRDQRKKEHIVTRSPR